MRRLLILPALCAIYSVVGASSCAIPLKVTVATDCIWYRKPPPLSDENKAHFAGAPENANAALFFDVVRDNKKKAAEFCGTSSTPK